MTEYLFSYGTLQTEKTQKELFGRILVGQRDLLPGYKTSTIEITDQSFLDKGDGQFQQIAIKSSDVTDSIEGTVFELSPEELIKADKYEPPNYKRTLVELQSGKKTWIYIQEDGESLSSFIFREATIEDIPALAALHVKTWAETYRTTLPPPVYRTREYQWRQQFEVKDGSWFCIVIENRDGKLVGFAKGKTYNDSDLPEFLGEVNKIYLLREYQRIGLGRKLLGHVARRFLSMGINNMVLFGIAENPSCKFHEAMGGERLYAKNGEFHGGYSWRDLQKLA